jgi:hypothetical protein
MNSAKLGMVLSILVATATGCIVEEASPEDDVVADEQIGTAEQALGDSCNNTDITITNSFEDGTRAARIKVFRVEYYSLSEGNWYTEDLTDEEIAYGSSHTWWNEDLAHAENDTLSQWRVYFKYVESDGDWSDLFYQQIDTPNDVCHADDNYAMTVN